MSETTPADWSPKDTRKLLDQAWEVIQWFRKKFQKSKPVPQPPEVDPPKPGILIIGPGGTGKTTLAKLLSGQMSAWVFGEAWKYEESYAEEHYSLIDDPGIEIVVPPGQAFRQAANWTDVRTDISSGRYSGVIVVAAYGHHTLSGFGYKGHLLYQGNKEKFLEQYRSAKLEEERRVIEFLRPSLESASGKIWLLTVIGKQDLWWDRRHDAETHYSTGYWSESFTALTAKLGEKNFRHERAFLSLLPANLEDPEGEVLFKTVAGYDMSKQADSVNRLLAALGGLRDWEG